MAAQKNITSDPAIIDAVMQKALVCRMAMCDGDTPYLVPMSFGFRNNTLYFHSSKKGQKMELLRRNSMVCFEAEADVQLDVRRPPCQCGFKYYCVIGTGRAVVVEDPEEKKAGLNCIMRHYVGKDYEYQPASLEGVAVIKIVIETITVKIAGYNT